MRFAWYFSKALTRTVYTAKDGSRYVRGRGRAGNFWSAQLSGPTKTATVSQQTASTKTIASTVALRALYDPSTGYAPPLKVALWRKELCRCPLCVKEPTFPVLIRASLGWRTMTRHFRALTRAFRKVRSIDHATRNSLSHVS